MKKGPRGGPFASAMRRGSDQHDLGADLGQAVEFLDVLVVKTDAAVRRLAPDLAGVVGAVDAVILPAEIERMGAKRIVRARGHEIRPVGVALLHRGGGRPGRALDLADHLGAAAAGQLIRDRNRGRVELVDRLVRGPEVQTPRDRVDEDGAVRGVAEIVVPVELAEARDVAAHVGVRRFLEALEAGVGRLGEHGRGSKACPGERCSAEESATIKRFARDGHGSTPLAAESRGRFARSISAPLPQVQIKPSSSGDFTQLWVCVASASGVRLGAEIPGDRE
ncbi:hypothetical protein SDC9_06414 [bioreactor metagenome]|uniref:Uncharacterized protein n=1 Tax=bioreactor metagenome TaxID=1076179 RepID=A0A644T3Y8_9ZZZZ